MKASCPLVVITGNLAVREESVQDGQEQEEVEELSSANTFPVMHLSEEEDARYTPPNIVFFSRRVLLVFWTQKETFVLIAPPRFGESARASKVVGDEDDEEEKNP